MSVQTEVNAPEGFRIFRIERDETSIIEYTISIDRKVTAVITDQSDRDAEYVERTLRYAVRQLALDVRDIIEETL